MLNEICKVVRYSDIFGQFHIFSGDDAFTAWKLKRFKSFHIITGLSLQDFIITLAQLAAYHYAFSAKLLFLLLSNVKQIEFY